MYCLWPLGRESVLKKSSLERALIVSASQPGCKSSCPDGKASALLEAVHKCQTAGTKQGESGGTGDGIEVPHLTLDQRKGNNPYWIFNACAALTLIAVANFGDLL